MDNIPDINKKINKMYDNAKYLDTYGGSYYGTILLFIVFLFIIGYLLVQINLEPLKKKFPQNKCNPAYIPFAGFIAKPPDQTAMEFTASNFSMCINQVLTMIVHNYTKPVNTVVNMLNTIFMSLMKAVAIIQKTVYRLKNLMHELMQLIMSRIMAAIMPFIKMIIKIKDSFGKLGAIMGSVLQMLIGLYLAAKAFMGSLIALTVLYLVVIAAILMVIFIIPIFGPPIAMFGLVAWAIMATASAAEVAEAREILLRCCDQKLKCTCSSHKPGITIRPSRSMTRWFADVAVPAENIPVMTPSSTTMSTAPSSR